MKIVSFKKTNHSPQLGILDSFDHVWSVPERTLQIDQAGLIEMIHASQGTRPIAFSESIPLADVRLAAPIPRPSKVICVGKNYKAHAQEMGGEPPTLPVIFNKFPSTVIGSQEAIELPAISEQVDYEGELVVVVGQTCRHVPRKDALSRVLGFTCGNDVTARDWQKGRPGGQWLLGKSCDTFAPIGPWVVTANEIADPHRLEITTRVNGDIKQQATTEQLIFQIDALIEHISRFVTLDPGDLLFTGTPAGVGAGRTPPEFLQPGDRVEVEIEGVGCLQNHVACPADSS